VLSTLQQAYVAPDEVNEEAIDAVGVVTETQLEEEEKLRKRRYLRRGIILFILLVVAVVVPVVVVQGNGGGITVEVNATDSPSEAPSMAPTSSTFAQLLSTIEVLYGEENSVLFVERFSDEESAQFRAADWAANVAPIGLSGEDPRMVNRYALATLYFATNGDDWFNCGRDSTNCETTQEWLTSENECNWYAIECADPDNGDYSVVNIFFRKYLHKSWLMCMSNTSTSLPWL
jgi:hypothetical protein